MADAYANTATQGFHERAPNDRVFTGKNSHIKVVLTLQVAISTAVLGLSLALIATQPEGSKTAPQVNYTIFVTIFSCLSWFFIFFADRFERKYTRSFIIAVGIVAAIFYVAAALALTVAIAPASSCSDRDFLGKNKVIAGVSSRCRMLEADIAMLWLGKLLLVIWYSKTES